jgi:hypothetical protein
MPTFTQTLTPIPTLAPEEALEKVQELLRTNMDCQFPCWWGITPGASSWSKTRNYIKSFAFRQGEEIQKLTSDKKLSFDAYFPLDDAPSLMNSLLVTFTVDPGSGVIQQIYTSQDYSLPTLQDIYGSPDQVWLTASGIPVTGPAAYHIELFFQKTGIIASIGGDARLIHRDEGDYTIVCQETLLKDARGLTFWSPDDLKTFEDFSELYPIGKYRLLEDVTNLQVQEFIELLKQEGANECMEIPMRFWYEP